MLSLSNAFDKSDMTDFLKKINNFLNVAKNVLNCFRTKNNGISATLVYERGILKRVYQR